MRQGFICAAWMGLAVVLATAAGAEPITSKAAKKQLFKGDGYLVEVLDGSGIDATQLVQVQAIAKAMRSRQVALQFAAQGYYGAIAVVPGQPLSEKAMAISAGLNSPAAARARAKAGCEALGAGACVVAADILPKRYKPRDFTLSEAASTAVFDGWDQGTPTYLAMSPSTTAWVVAKGTGADDTALERCNETAKATGGPADCTIVIADE